MRLLLSGLLLGGLAALAALAYVMAGFGQTGPLQSEKIVRLERGQGLRQIADALAREQVIASPLVFLGGAWVSGTARQLKAGEYRFPANASPKAVAELLAAGRVVVHRLTVPEGLTVRDVLQLVEEAEPLEGRITAVPAEGSLLPETYSYTWGERRSDMVERMSRAMREALAELWARRAPDIVIGKPAEALTLASIVEKETGIAAERPLVASVFINRMRRGMKLQSDPTVIYGITRGRAAFGRAISRADLDADNAWNTYRIDGLPPTPIANPGRASIEAVLNPRASRFLYFVADGNGGHAFAETLDEHNRNVRAWRAQQGGR